VDSYRELVVWQRSMALTKEVYKLAAAFPKDERFRLVDQVLRASVSVPANIAEGFGRAQTREFLRFLAIAKGSLNETETYVLLAIDLGIVSDSQTERIRELVSEIGRLLTGLRRSLQRRLHEPAS
jgi:four helix bundle protein